MVEQAELTPFIMHKMIHKITAQTMGSQFPLVPMVKVNGLKSQAATDQSRRSSGTPRSFRIASTNKPTSKSENEMAPKILNIKP